MLAVQGVEMSLCWLYVVANVDPQKVSNASLKRQWHNAFTRLWGAFQTGSAGMKLADRDKGLRDHISESLYKEINDFIQQRRNPLAHKFLIERASADGSRFAQGTILELLEITITATSLTKKLQAAADDIRRSWPTQPDPPAEVTQLAEAVGRMAMLRQFPEDTRSA
jgi:hypothetical protein